MRKAESESESEPEAELELLCCGRRCLCSFTCAMYHAVCRVRMVVFVVIK